MKKTILASLLIMGLTLGAFAQEKVKEKDIPAAVQTGFKAGYPEAKDIDWKMKDGTYKAKFKMNGNNNIASFDATGKMLSKGTEIRESDLPAAVASAVRSVYAGRNIDNVYSVEKDGNTNYLVKLKGDPETKVLYSADGQVIKEKMD